MIFGPIVRTPSGMSFHFALSSSQVLSNDSCCAGSAFSVSSGVGRALSITSPLAAACLIMKSQVVSPMPLSW